MDPQTFDRRVAAAARRPSRRAALRLLAGGLLGGLLAKRGVAPARAAQRADSDGDGLFDDDELYVYGTDPYTYDTDYDGTGDGAEVYYGTDPLAGAAPDLGPAPPICRAIGIACDYDHECCGASVFCCWDGVSLQTECTDVTLYGGTCPD